MSSVITPTTTGCVHLVVGPSGAGKDTLIEAARASLAGEPTFLFPRRIVTRAAGQWEAHESLDASAFALASGRGAFALEWQAHGLSYALPREIDDAVAVGHHVVVNVSRGVVAAARARWGAVRVIYVDAPLQVRAQRLRQRARDGESTERLTRADAFAAQDADIVIVNDGDLNRAIAAFVAALR